MALLAAQSADREHDRRGAQGGHRGEARGGRRRRRSGPRGSGAQWLVSATRMSCERSWSLTQRTNEAEAAFSARPSSRSSTKSWKPWIVKLQEITRWSTCSARDATSIATVAGRPPNCAWKCSTLRARQWFHTRTASAKWNSRRTASRGSVATGRSAPRRARRNPARSAGCQRNNAHERPPPGAGPSHGRWRAPRVAPRRSDRASTSRRLMLMRSIVRPSPSSADHLAEQERLRGIAGSASSRTPPGERGGARDLACSGRGPDRCPLG